MDLTLARQRARARIAAKQFAASIPVNMALKVPDSVIDSLNDYELQVFREWLEDHRYRQREDFRWERS